MLQVARLAPKLLGDSAELVASFLRSQLSADGGFAGRDGVSDLYYTVFGIEGLLALRADLPAAQIACYLESFGDGAGLDFVHLCCLARCWAGLPASLCRAAPRSSFVERIEQHRSADGGYHPDPGAEQGTAYGCFLAVGAYQDLGQPLNEPSRLLACLQSLRAGDGGYSNQPDAAVGLTPATAAVATLLRQLSQPAGRSLSEWLMAQACPNGGFYAVPGAPMPDLLSTATALHALAGLHVEFRPIEEACLDYLDTLWTNRGGFYGSWADDVLDCEYTYYGLLALGHLSL